MVKITLIVVLVIMSALLTTTIEGRPFGIGQFGPAAGWNSNAPRGSCKPIIATTCKIKKVLGLQYSDCKDTLSGWSCPPTTPIDMSKYGKLFDTIAKAMGNHKTFKKL